MTIEMFFDVVGAEVNLAANLTVRKDSIVAVCLKCTLGDFKELAGLLDIEPILGELFGVFAVFEFLVDYSGL